VLLLLLLLLLLLFKALYSEFLRPKQTLSV